MAAFAPESWALWLSWPVLGVLGLLVGSFLNVVIHRLPRILLRQYWRDVAEQLDDEGEWALATGAPRPANYEDVGPDIAAAIDALPPLGIATPRSRCGACGHAIRWYENIPVVSWLALRRRCSACGTPISARYPLVELATAALFAAVAWRYGPVPMALFWCAVMALLLAASMIDADTRYLPDVLVQPILWGGLVVAALGWNLPLATAFWGAVAGYGVLWALSKGYRLVRGVDGMGEGDMKLLAALCACLGWQALLPIALMAAVVGLLVNVPLRLLGRTRDGQQLPFGPFLAGGGAVVILAGVPQVLGWLRLGDL